jgi:hypothetical protein
MRIQNQRITFREVAFWQTLDNIEQFWPNMLLLQVITDFTCIPQSDRKWWPTDSEK